MTIVAIPERGAPPKPPGWPEGLHEGPAAREGAVPGYLLGRGAQPEDGTPDHTMEVEYGGERDRIETCDLVVVGSGAGGASLALEAAERGLDVLVVEEGDYYTSKNFVGPPLERLMRFCRDGAATQALGRVPIPIPMGKTVGGTTTVNSGTCFRAPARVLRLWEERYGLEGIDAETMDPYFRRVETILNVRPVPWELLGPNGWIADAGARVLGLTGGPVLRNITSCHGAGQCAFGCPTDAKQAMHLSYLPRAHRRGARIYARTRAEWIVLEGGRAAGITGRFLRASGEPLGRLRVRARAVVLACGAVMTPVFLLRNRLANSSGQVGRNLRIHPATGVVGWFADPIFGWRGTLQPYYIDSLFDSHEVLMEATNSVPSVAAGVFPGYGAATKEMLAAFPHLATLGLLVSDTSKGRVLRGPGDQPIITYRLNDRDTRNLYAGLALAAEVLLAAGATSVSAGTRGLDGIADADGVERLRKGRGPGALRLSAYHPMGTARMGRDPASSVVDGWLESHDVPGLYVVDAGVFPSCLGVNPQVTIMAFASRTAGRIADVL